MSCHGCGDGHCHATGGFDTKDGVPLISVASCNNISKMPAIGVLLEDAANDNESIINIKTTGEVSGFNTSIAKINSGVYVGTDGAIVFKDPYIKNKSCATQQLGIVISSLAAPYGKIELFPIKIEAANRNVVLSDGSVPFVETVSGINPIKPFDLATKSYVDSRFSSVGALGGLTSSSTLTIVRQILTSASGTYTPSSGGCKFINVRAYGGAGGGGGVKASSSNISISGGGASGGYSEKLISKPNASYAYTCGAAGTAGTNAPSAGGTGGDTTFGTTIVVAKGGTGGSAGPDVLASTFQMARGGVSVASGTGDLVGSGEHGGFGFGTTSYSTSGNGGNSQVGNGASGASGAHAGSAGTGYSSGGSGAICVAGNSDTGGAGTPGCIIVDEYY